MNTDTMFALCLILLMVMTKESMSAPSKPLSWITTSEGISTQLRRMEAIWSEMIYLNRSLQIISFTGHHYDGVDVNLCEFFIFPSNIVCLSSVDRTQYSLDHQCIHVGPMKEDLWISKPSSFGMTQLPPPVDISRGPKSYLRSGVDAPSCMIGRSDFASNFIVGLIETDGFNAAAAAVYQELHYQQLVRPLMGQSLIDFTSETWRINTPLLTLAKTGSKSKKSYPGSLIVKKERLPIILHPKYAELGNVLIDQFITPFTLHQSAADYSPYFPFIAVHWRRGDQLVGRCQSNTDTSVNCASADVFVKVVKSTLDKRYKREMFLRNKKDLAGVVVPNVRDIRSMDVYICTNEDRPEQLEVLVNAGFKIRELTSDWQQIASSMGRLYPRAASRSEDADLLGPLDIFLIDCYIMSAAEHFIHFGRSSVHSLVGRLRHQRELTVTRLKRGLS